MYQQRLHFTDEKTEVEEYRFAMAVQWIIAQI